MIVKGRERSSVLAWASSAIFPEETFALVCTEGRIGGGRTNEHNYSMRVSEQWVGKRIYQVRGVGKAKIY
jgi:hypothetical protein